jgi:hypothetical protein
MTRDTWKKAYAVVVKAAWASFLFFLPVTSFPFFPPAFGGEALVRPLSLYPLFFVLLLGVTPRLITRPIPKTLLPLLFFVLVAVASSLLSLLRGIEPALGITATARVVRGIFTLAIGCAIYLGVALMPETVDDLRFSIRWIYAGCGMALLWGSLQAVYILHFNAAWFGLLEKAQRYISFRRLLPDRISGMTYEPHWFAEQIMLLLVPWAFAAILCSYTAFRRRWRWLTIEWLMLGWAVIILPFTFSRSGLLNLVVVLTFGVIFLRPKNRLKTKDGAVPAEQSIKPKPLLRRNLGVALVVCAVLLPIYLIGTRNLFFARLWSYWQNRNVSLVGYLSYIGLDARVIYSQAALNTYNAFPLLGVGLGNYAFYFEEMLPYRPLADVPEILLMITPEMGRDRLITSKNFHFRILAETGIVGAAAFLAFLIANIGCGLYLWLSSDNERKYWGTASLCGLAAFGLSAFTFDSFVIPNMWVLFGLITAAAQVLEGIPQPNLQASNA